MAITVKATGLACAHEHSWDVYQMPFGKNKLLPSADHQCAYDLQAPGYVYHDLFISHFCSAHVLVPLPACWPALQPPAVRQLPLFPYPTGPGLPAVLGPLWVSLALPIVPGEVLLLRSAW